MSPKGERGLRGAASPKGWFILNLTRFVKFYFNLTRFEKLFFNITRFIKFLTRFFEIPNF